MTWQHGKPHDGAKLIEGPADSAVFWSASLAEGDPSKMESREQPAAWDRAKNRLAELGAAGGRIDEDGIEWPSPAAISAALSRMQQLPCLLESVFPDGEGGVVIERRNGLIIERAEVDRSGNAEYLKFEDCKLVERRPL